jgi:ABC-2 type transport system permease protein
LSSAPDILKFLSTIDPLTYGVNGLRYLLTGASEIGFATSLLVMAGLTALFITIAMRSFSRIEE